MFVTYIILFMLSQALQRSGNGSPFINAYMDDLLFFPITLHLIYGWFEKVRKVKNYTMPVRHILVSVVFISIVFEGLLPLIDNTMTGDPLDVVCYIIGATIFEAGRVIKKNVSS